MTHYKLIPPNIEWHMPKGVDKYNKYKTFTKKQQIILEQEKIQDEMDWGKN